MDTLLEQFAIRLKIYTRWVPSNLTFKPAQKAYIASKLSIGLQACFEKSPARSGQCY